VSDPDPGGFAHLSDADDPTQDHDAPHGQGDEWVEWVEITDGPDGLLDGTDPDEEDDEDAVEFTYDATLAPDDPGMAELLERGAMEVLGLMPWSSNGTYLVRVERKGDHAPAIYKPERGERPLWDFPGALWKREVAAYELSHTMGLGLVPTTVARVSAPLGRGSVQAFVPARFAEHYFTIRERPQLGPTLRALCAFDLVANSADRKGGHCLIDDDERVWAIDNGLTFHDEFKVRTVIWDYAGEPLPTSVADALVQLIDDGVPPSLCALLTPDEQVAMMDRAGALLAGGHFPHDPTGRRYPWPLV
jgi:hypothetical protein